MADVRLNVISRRPGCSKTKPLRALAGAGVRYGHPRAMGDPRENRPDLRGGDLPRGRDAYRRLLGGPDARAELRLLAALTTECVVAVMCFEVDVRQCHRAVVIEELAGRDTRRPQRPRSILNDTSVCL